MRQALVVILGLTLALGFVGGCGSCVKDDEPAPIAPRPPGKPIDSAGVRVKGAPHPNMVVGDGGPP